MKFLKAAKKSDQINPCALQFGADLLILKMIVAALFGSSLSALSPESAMAAKNEIGDQINVAIAGLTNADFKTQVESASLMMMMIIDAAEADLRSRVASTDGPADG